MNVNQPRLESNSTKIRIAVVDDHPLLRQALRNVLEKQDDFEIVAEGRDGEEAVIIAGELLPDIIIMDISMPNLNGLEATKQIKEKFPDIGILALTVHSDSAHILKILQAGAGGYLTKSVYGEEVIQAVHALVAGEIVLSPSVSEQILKFASRHITPPLDIDRVTRITARESEILILISRGIRSKDIAQRLGLSLRTVKGCLADIFLKLNVKTRTEAVTVGLQKGLLTIEDIKQDIS
jgi:NarL family two-component system response regulator LiaR